MATCEMCGSESNSLISIKVAGSIMKVCRNCKPTGKEVEIHSPNLSHTFRKTQKQDNFVEEVTLDYAKLIQSAMAKRGLNVHQLARVINIKESTLNNYLKGKIKPDLNHAKKIANFLEIKLTEEVQSSSANDENYTSNSSSTNLSLGDLIKKQLGDK